MSLSKPLTLYYESRYRFSLLRLRFFSLGIGLVTLEQLLSLVFETKASQSWSRLVRLRLLGLETEKLVLQISAGSPIQSTYRKFFKEKADIT